ncbi:MAG: response regulator transcription factor [Acidimicrobiaceae bacterium]|jgi:DNA-binding response OmpR family regulator|nr:response regulator transcription factor [Acidimicrobiaceae bacterium]MCO4834916.1 response regulator transcription factor [Acidimicrobiaceae bacterium]
MIASRTVLVVDDEPMVREVLAHYLTHDGFTVVEAADGEEAVAKLDACAPDLVLLDLMLPKKHGLEVLRHARSTSDVPVILLTALGDEKDRVAGLELGADDYVVKPFSPREVAARVKSVLRRASGPANPVILSFGEVTVDLDRRRIERAEAEVELTRLEFDLLAFLVSHPNRVVSRDELLQNVWDSSAEWQDPATVTVHVRRLRQKLEHDPSQPEHILTVYGVGYRFEL